MKKIPQLLIGLCLIVALAACAQPTPTAQPTALPSPKVEFTNTSVPTVMPPTTVPTHAPTLAPTAPQPTQEVQAGGTPAITDQKGLYQVTRQISLPGSRRIVWASDGKSLAVLSDNQVTLLDAQTLTVLATSTVPNIILDFSSDGKTLLTTTDQQNVTLLDVTTGQQHSYNTGSVFNGASFSPNGSLFVTAAMDNWKGSIFDSSTGVLDKELTGFETAAPVYSVQFAANAVDLVWLARGTVQLQDIASGQLAASIGHEDFVNTLATAHNQRLLVTSAAGTIGEDFVPALFVWDPDTGEKLLAMQVSAPVYSLDFSTDDSLLAAGNSDGVTIYTTSDMNQETILPVQASGVADARFSPVDHSLASLDGNGTLSIWEPVTP